MDSRDRKLIAIIQQACHSGAKLTFAEASELARTMNPWRGSNEPVQVFTKTTGKKVRHLVKFGLLRGSLHRLVADIVRAVMPDCPYEYAIPGKGRDYAAKSLVEGLNHGKKSGGLVIADVAAFYPSIPIETVCKLVPLPRSVVLNSAYLKEGEEFELGGTILEEDVKKQIRKGLPTGSLLSGALARYVMRSLTEAVAHLGCPSSYVDDVAIRPNSVSGGQAIVETLKNWAQAHLFGPVPFKILRTVKLADLTKARIDFLGYRLRLDVDGFVRLTPTPRAIRRFRQKLIRTLHKVHQDVEGVAWLKADDFRKSQGCWDFTVEAAAIFEAQIITEINAERDRRKFIAKMKGKGMSPLSAPHHHGHIALA